jgi:uncharacterized Zn finger protein (UPF0148 family)
MKCPHCNCELVISSTAACPLCENRVETNSTAWEKGELSVDTAEHRDLRERHANLLSALSWIASGRVIYGVAELSREEMMAIADKALKEDEDDGTNE